MEARRVASLLAVLVVGVAGWSLPTSAQPVGHVLITAVYYDTYVSGEGDEFVRLTNPTGVDADLTGWLLRDHQNDSVRFPAGAMLPAGASIFVTGSATDFRRDMVVNPDWEYRANTDATPDMTRTGTFTLANAGDEVRLYDAANTLVDAVGWVLAPWNGWSGAPLEDMSEGVILERDADGATGQHVDTDTAADWDDSRIYVAGQSHFAPASFDASHATMFSSPDSSYAAVADFLATAEQRVDIGLYELTSTSIGQVLQDRCGAGLQVRLLLEGGPAGFATTDRYQEDWILDHLVQAGCAVRFMVTNDTQGVHDRYAYLHAKYAVADGARALVMSGNWKSTGLPQDPSYGNREWGVVVDSPDLAAYLEGVFDDDWDDAHRDILPFGTGTDWRYLPPPPGFEPDTTVPNGTYAPFFPSRSVDASFHVRPILAPDTSTRDSDALIAALRNAQSEVLIEQMYAHKHWGPSATGTPQTDPDLYLEAAIQAARDHGASVYVLLGDEFIEEEDTRNNQDTVDYLRQVAADEGLPIQARLVNHTIAELVKIHNKGLVIDNTTAFVGSINWGRASAEDNRELGLLMDQPSIAAFYRDIFWYDWAPLLFKPVTDLTVSDLRLVPVPLVLPGPVQAPLDDPTRRVVQVTVANVGGYGAGDFDVTVTATPTLLGPTEEVLHARVSDLAQGATKTLTASWATNLRVGEFRLDATVDSAGEVAETDEANNTLSAVFPLVAPVPGVSVSAGLAVAP